MKGKYDFSGWATRNDLKCSDGRTIRRDAFKENDGQTVPLVWQHLHNDPMNVLGHALLENRDEGVYAYCSFNDTDAGQNAKELVEHGDITSLSIYANKLKQRGGDVLHGAIREVSLVLSGANPGAYIDYPILEHSGEESYDEAVIYTGEEIEMYKDEHFEHAENDGENDSKSIADIVETMNEDQKKALYYLVAEAADGDDDDEDEEVEHSDYYYDDEDDYYEGDGFMKHNVFDPATDTVDNTLSHSEMEVIFNDAKRGTLKDSVLAHADEYGIEDIEFLFPEVRNLNNPPEFIGREMGWVQVVMNGVHKSPFSRVKSSFANITEDEARARGYIKGHLKKEEVFSLLKRATDPQTIYKKQKLDRDDITDITDFDVVSWIKGEMRMMLDEEIARAILIGDGRLPSDDDHISHDHIRPIWKDHDLFTVKAVVKKEAEDADTAKGMIDMIIRSRKEYKGSGTPTLFTTEDWLTEMLLLEDKMGHKLYKTEGELATTLRVGKIVTVPVMENQKNGDNDLAGIIVNLNDYNVGADKGGAISMFDDFDIDYNQMKYLIETRCSGALVKPFSAIAIELGAAKSISNRKEALDDAQAQSKQGKNFPVEDKTDPGNGEG